MQEAVKANHCYSWSWRNLCYRTDCKESNIEPNLLRSKGACSTQDPQEAALICLFVFSSVCSCRGQKLVSYVFLNNQKTKPKNKTNPCCYLIPHLKPSLDTGANSSQFIITDAKNVKNQKSSDFNTEHKHYTHKSHLVIF